MSRDTATIELSEVNVGIVQKLWDFCEEVFHDEFIFQVTVSDFFNTEYIIDTQDLLDKLVLSSKWNKINELPCMQIEISSNKKITDNFINYLTQLHINHKENVYELERCLNYDKDSTTDIRGFSDED